MIRFELLPDVTDFSDWKLGTIGNLGNDYDFTFSIPPTNEELSQLATALQGTEELFLFSQIDTIMPAFPDEAGRKHARTVIKDYLTLVGH